MTRKSRLAVRFAALMLCTGLLGGATGAAAHGDRPSGPLDPDLIISDLSVTPNPCNMGSELTAEMRGFNSASLPTGAVFRIDFWEHLTSAPTGPAGSNAHWSVNGLFGHVHTDWFTHSFTPSTSGAFEAWALIDGTNAVVESDETNNTTDDDYVVNPSGLFDPDLVISDLSVTPDPSSMGAELTAQVRGYNSATYAAGPDFRVDFWEHRASAPTNEAGSDVHWSVSGLFSRVHTDWFSHSFTPAAVGSYTAWALIDSTNTVAESDETNNTTDDDYVVNPSGLFDPDLIISDLSVTPDPSNMGTELTAQVRGYNNATYAAGPDFRVDFWEHLTSAPAGPAGSNAHWSVSGLFGRFHTDWFSYSFTPSAAGSYTAWALIDSEAEVAESDEGNNAASEDYLVEYSFQPDACVRGRGDAAWIGEDYYGEARRQTKTQSIDPGSTGVFHVSIQNDGQTADSFVIRGQAGTATWPVTYHDAFEGGNEITPQVAGDDGWSVGPLAPGGAIPMRCEVTAPASAAGGTRRSRIVSATSVGDSAKWDTVKMVIRVRVKRQPDGWIRLPGQPWKGDDIHNRTGARQDYTQRIPAAGKAIYHLYWQNDGNVTDSLKINGPGNSGYWKVRYYDAFSGGTDITSQVTGTGWLVPDVPRGGKKPMRVEVSVNSGAPSGIASTIRVKALSEADPKKVDVVKAKTIVR